ncbi:hypothetical protein [Lysinibacillus parviboronicapiens]|nr:hypothetical protein [Lysinibacillus parviboronicapiens]
MFSNNILQHLSANDKERVYTKCQEILKQWMIDYWRLRFIAYKQQ